MNFKKGFIKKLMICISLAATVMLSGCKKEESYRIISAHEVEGTSNVTREKVGTMDVYQGMDFQSGDNVEVLADSMLRLSLDDDKFMTLEANTKMNLIAEGDENSERTVIDLEEGAVTSTLNKKLNSESTYEVNTPKATMSVRGTTFRVAVDEINSGTQMKTVIQLFEGELAIQLLNENNDPYSDPATLTSGNETIIITDISVDSGMGNVSFFEARSQPIDYSKIPDIVKAHIIEYYDNGNSALADAVAALTGNTVSETIASQLEENTETTTEDSSETKADDISEITSSEKTEAYSVENDTWDRNTDDTSSSAAAKNENDSSTDSETDKKSEITDISDEKSEDKTAVTTVGDIDNNDVTVTVQSDEKNEVTSVSDSSIDEPVTTTMRSTEKSTTASSYTYSYVTRPVTGYTGTTPLYTTVPSGTAATTTTEATTTTAGDEVITKPHVTFNYNGGELEYNPDYDPDNDNS
ncbi:MAG: FecR domain-containing protein [Oscillospiraceae bacterium]|nr:FecR domain-containing protein [Oscillospiraceae bacterium]